MKLMVRIQGETTPGEIELLHKFCTSTGWELEIKQGAIGRPRRPISLENITKAVVQACGNQARAAELLGLDRDKGAALISSRLKEAGLPRAAELATRGMQE